MYAVLFLDFVHLYDLRDMKLLNPVALEILQFDLYTVGNNLVVTTLALHIYQLKLLSTSHSQHVEAKGYFSLYLGELLVKIHYCIFCIIGFVQENMSNWQSLELFHKAKTNPWKFVLIIIVIVNTLSLIIHMVLCYCLYNTTATVAAKVITPPIHHHATRLYVCSKLSNLVVFG